MSVFVPIGARGLAFVGPGYVIKIRLVLASLLVMLCLAVRRYFLEIKNAVP